MYIVRGDLTTVIQCFSRTTITLYFACLGPAYTVEFYWSHVYSVDIWFFMARVTYVTSDLPLYSSDH